MGGDWSSNPSPLLPLPIGWRVAAIDDLCMDVTSGGTPLRSNPDFFFGGRYNWFKTGELKDSVLFEAAEKITGSALNQSSAKLFPKETVLMAMYGDGKTITSLGILGREAATNQACCAMITDRAVCEPRFLFYALLFHRGDFIRLATGGAQRNLSGKLIRRFTLNVPPLSEQKAIAHILGTLDDKIELNRRMNETLEAMARALFKSWFVDFDPVRAKAEGRNPGLPQHLADLFPDSFEDSELGVIPRGWRVAPLPNVIDVNPSRPLRKGSVAPYLDMANMPTRGHTPDAVIYRPFGSGMRFMNGDTLVARITPCLENGKTAFIDFLEDGQVGWGSTEYIVLRPKSPLPHEFAYCLARSPEFREFAIQSMTGSSGRQRVPAEALSHFQVAVVPDTIAKMFGRAIAPLFTRVSIAAEESRSLAALRDTLLPKLISGELRIKDAERFVERAL